VWWFVFAAAAWSSCSPAPASGLRLPAPGAPFEHEARIEGLIARWRLEGATWEVQLEAETTGWVVFGTNSTSDITGAELFFGHVVNGVPVAAHHEVLAPGHHAPASPSRVELIGAAQSSDRTIVRMRVPAPPLDEDGATWLVLAWSHAPELDHHSAVRRHLRVTPGAR